MVALVYTMYIFRDLQAFAQFMKLSVLKASRIRGADTVQKMSPSSKFFKNTWSLTRYLIVYRKTRNITKNSQNSFGGKGKRNVLHCFLLK